MQRATHSVTFLARSSGVWRTISFDRRSRSVTIERSARAETALPSATLPPDAVAVDKVYCCLRRAHFGGNYALRLSAFRLVGVMANA